MVRAAAAANGRPRSRVESHSSLYLISSSNMEQKCPICRAGLFPGSDSDDISSTISATTMQPHSEPTISLSLSARWSINSNDPGDSSSNIRNFTRRPMRPIARDPAYPIGVDGNEPGSSSSSGYNVTTSDILTAAVIRRIFHGRMVDSLNNVEQQQQSRDGSIIELGSFQGQGLIMIRSSDNNNSNNIDNTSHNERNDAHNDERSLSSISSEVARSSDNDAANQSQAAVCNNIVPATIDAAIDISAATAEEVVEVTEGMVDAQLRAILDPLLPPSLMETNDISCGSSSASCASSESVMEVEEVGERQEEEGEALNISLDANDEKEDIVDCVNVGSISRNRDKVGPSNSRKRRRPSSDKITAFDPSFSSQTNQATAPSPVTTVAEKGGVEGLETEEEASLTFVTDKQRRKLEYHF
jgi:hypothetical protein